MYAAAPFTMRWRAEWLGWREYRYPDAVTDTTRRRKMAARRRLKVVRRVRQQAIRLGYGPALVVLTAHLPGELYDLEAHRQARQLVREIVGTFPAWFKLEDGREAGLHVHIVAPLAVMQRVNKEVHALEVWSLRGLLAYLSKPVDGNAARSNHRRTLSMPRVLAASERYLSARAAALVDGRARLPVCSGLLNVPRRTSKRAAPSVGLILDVLLWQCRRRAAALASALASVQAALSLSRRCTAPPRLRRHTARRCYLPGLPVRLSRRLLLIGHARPPPIGKPRPGQWFPVMRGSLNSRRPSLPGNKRTTAKLPPTRPRRGHAR
jgi:hypothetical protein